MAAILSAIKILFRVQASSSKEFEIDVTPSGVVKVEENETLAHGYGDDQVEELYHDEGELASGVDLELDLFGTILNLYGEQINFTAIKAIIVRNISNELGTPTTSELHVGGGTDGAGTNAFDTWITSTADDGSEAVRIPVEGAFAIFAPKDGFACSAGSDILRIVNTDGAAAAKYQVMVLGKIT